MNAGNHLVIVGGGPGGLSVARAYRSSGGHGRVTIIADEDMPPYRRPPLTKEFLRGEIEHNDLFIEPSNWYEKHGIDLRLSTIVTALDTQLNAVETKSGERIHYDACVLATGSEPVRPPVPGGEDPAVHVMRTVADSSRLASGIREGSRAVVVGSGFIGCEAAASLSARGAEVTLVSMEELPQKERLGEPAGLRILSWLENYGISFHPGVEVEGIERSGEDFVVTASSEALDTDTVLFGTGVRPRIGLAADAGLTIQNGGVVTDEHMMTSRSNVYAAGDITYAFNARAGRHLRVEHWGEALNQGKTAGEMLAGRTESSWNVAPGFWSTIGDRTLKHVAWGDGWDDVRLVDGGETRESFTVWYGRDGICVGVLTHNADEDYAEGRKLIESGKPLPL